MQNRRFNKNLARRVILTGAFASVVSYYLSEFNHAKNLAWVSDQDAITHRYGGIVYDLAYVFYLLQRSEQIEASSDGSIVFIDQPKFHFVELNISGSTEFDELIRIPDYIAGTIASVSTTILNAKEKHINVLGGSIANSTNHAIIQLLIEDRILTARRFDYSFSKAKD